MRVLHDLGAVERWLRRDPVLHLYELGDLDQFFVERAVFFGHGDAVAMLYLGYAEPALLALGAPGEPAVVALLEALHPVLPRRFHAHLAPGVAHALGPWTGEDHGPYVKMRWARPEAVDPVSDDEVVALTPGDEGEAVAFYDRVYPEHFFDPRTLQLGGAVGARRDGRLVAAAGVHVLSDAQRVASLGNIAVDPTCRRQGLGRRLTAALCRSLASRVDTLALNVRADNGAARACYRALGFVDHATFHEWTFHLG